MLAGSATLLAGEKRNRRQGYGDQQRNRAIGERVCHVDPPARGMRGQGDI